MKKALRKIHLRQNGFTLIEILVSVAITGLVGTGAVMTIGQIFPQNQRANERVQAIEQVESVAYWINRDALVAQTVAPDNGSGFPLTLTWQGVNGNNNQVIYSRSGNSLQRSFSVNGGALVQTLIAQNINFDATETNCSYAISGILTFQVTSSVGTASETRIYQTKLRAAQPSS